MNASDWIFIASIAVTALLAFYQGVRVGVHIGLGFIIDRMPNDQLEALKSILEQGRNQ